MFYQCHYSARFADIITLNLTPTRLNTVNTNFLIKMKFIVPSVVYGTIREAHLPAVSPMLLKKIIPRE